MNKVNQILNEVLEVLDGTGVPNLHWVKGQLENAKFLNKDQTIFCIDALYDWDGDIEVSPVIEEDGFCEVTDKPELADFWSVYCHQHEGGVQCIADFNAEEQASTFASLLRLILTISLPAPKK